MFNMIQICLSVNWKTDTTNSKFYRDIPPNTTKSNARTLTFAGYCKRTEGCIKRVTWRPTQGTRSKLRPKMTYVDLLVVDIISASEVENSMQDRRLWQPIVSLTPSTLAVGHGTNTSAMPDGTDTSTMSDSKSRRN